MTFVNFGKQDYYKRMLELQEKLRKSEEERIRLEERFKLLMQESRNRHDACINRLRMRYIEFLEEQRERENRSGKLQEKLDRVDGQLASMTIKSEQLNKIRRYYENYLLRVNENQRSSDSGVTSQHDEKNSQRDPSVLSSRRHSIQNVPIKSSASTMFVPSRVTTPTLSKYNESRLVVDSPTPRNHIINSNFSLEKQFHSTPKISSNNQPQTSSSFASQIPEIRFNSSLSPIFISKDVQTDKPRNLIPDKFSAPVEARQILSGNGRIPWVSSARSSTLSADQSSFQAGINQYLHTSSFLPRSDSLQRSRMEFQKLPSWQSQQSILKNTFPTLSHQDHPLILTRNYKLRETNAEFDNSFLSRRNYPMLDGTSIDGERNSILDKSEDYQTRFSRSDERSSSRYFRRFDFNSIFKETDYLLPRSKYLVNSTNTKTPLNSSKSLRGSRSNCDTHKEFKEENNELDRYLVRIKDLHKDLNVQSIEDLDHEQNTSGDLLELTLSDDDTDFPVRAKTVSKYLSKFLNQREDSNEQIELIQDHPMEKINSSGPEPQQSIFSKNNHEKPTINTAQRMNFVTEECAPKTGTSLNNNSEFEKPWEDGDKNIESGTDERMESDGEHKSDINEEAVGTPVSEIKVVGSEGNCGTENDGTESEDKKGLREKTWKEENIEPSSESQSEMNGIERKDNEGNLDQNTVNQNMSEGLACDTNMVYRGYPEYSSEVYKRNSQQCHADKQYIWNPDQESSQQYSQDPSQQYNIDREYLVELDQQYSHDLNQASSQNPEQQNNQNLNQEYSRNSKVEYSQDLNQEYIQNPDQQNNQDPNQEYNHDSNQEYIQNSNQHYIHNPNEEYSQDPNQQYSQDPNQVYSHDLNEKYSQEPNQIHSQDSNQDDSQDLDEQYIQNPYQEYSQDPNQEYSRDRNEEYNQDPIREYSQNPNQQYIQDPHQEYSQNLSGEYSQYPNKQYRYSQEAKQQYNQDSSQQYNVNAKNLVDLNQQYSHDSNQVFVQDPNQQYFNDQNQYGINGQYQNPIYEYAQHNDHQYPGVPHQFDSDQEYQLPNIEYNQIHDYSQQEEDCKQGQSQMQHNVSYSDQQSDQVDALRFNEEENFERVKVGTREKSANLVEAVRDDVINLESEDTESTIERNASNAESDFDFN